MSKIQFLSLVEQVAGYLRGELLRGRWSGTMPGKHRLAEESGVNHKTVEAALRQLEAEGLLIPQGQGRKRLIRLPKNLARPALRVAMLAGEPSDLRQDYQVELRHELLEAGHHAYLTPLTILECGMDLKRIQRMVEKTEADAWVVTAGSVEVLEWFLARKTPAFALFGRRRSLPIAGVGPDKIPAMSAATQTLIGHGHQRIVLLARRMRRLPKPGASERAFLDELAAHGIDAGSYHLPDWEENIDGFYKRLDALFQVTPPTALIIDESQFFIAAFQFCANQGLRVPQDVSLVCTDYDPDFDWCRPSVAHIRWESRPVVQRILRWAANVSHGKEDLRQTLTQAEFVPGGTIGPAKGME
jgi:DNA-binding LacI/PurR family transcriptional regulator